MSTNSKGIQKKRVKPLPPKKRTVKPQKKPRSGSHSLSPPPSPPAKLIIEADLVDEIAPGEGGMGRVFRYRTNTGFELVQKTVKDQYKSHQVNRLQKEIDALRQLAHPHIVPMYARSSSDSDELFYVMPYYKLGSLDSYLSRLRKKLRIDRALLFMEQLCDGLGAAHEMDVYHRDLTPRNILLLNEDHLIIADWGLVYLDDGHSTRVIGTTDYIAPELFKIDPETKRPYKPSPQSDIYSLGKVFTKIIAATGDEAWGNKLKNVIAKMTKATPSSRYKSCKSVLQQLRAANSQEDDSVEIGEDEGEPMPALQQPPPPPRPSPSPQSFMASPHSYHHLFNSYMPGHQQQQQRLHQPW